MLKYQKLLPVWRQKYFMKKLFDIEVSSSFTTCTLTISISAICSNSSTILILLQNPQALQALHLQRTHHSTWCHILSFLFKGTSPSHWDKQHSWTALCSALVTRMWVFCAIFCDIFCASVFPFFNLKYSNLCACRANTCLIGENRKLSINTYLTVAWRISITFNLKIYVSVVAATHNKIQLKFCYFFCISCCNGKPIIK